MTILFDAAPVTGGIAIFAGVAFFFVFLAIAFFVFKMLKKTVKMAFRVVIVAVILAIAVAGSIFLFAAGTVKGPRPTPRPTSTR
ncbi:MAG: hypothetical protein IPO41_05870 [Acidobacteria bacterium]|nr:hypothetical protein [Acidobacteriota bacterium]